MEGKIYYLWCMWMEDDKVLIKSLISIIISFDLSFYDNRWFNVILVQRFW